MSVSVLDIVCPCLARTHIILYSALLSFINSSGMNSNVAGVCMQRQPGLADNATTNLVPLYLLSYFQPNLVPAVYFMACLIVHLCIL